MKVIGWFGVAVLVSSSCSRSSGSAVALGTLLEGVGTTSLKIDQATPPDVTAALGADLKGPFSDGNKGLQEMRSPTVQLHFVPDEGGVSRLYAVRTTLGINLKYPVFVGKTGKGLQLLDSAQTVTALYGQPQGTWIQLWQQILYFEEGVVVVLQHPTKIKTDLGGQYSSVCEQLSRTPREDADSLAVAGVMVVRPFSVLKSGQRALGTQQVVTGPPETTLLTNAF